MRTFLFFVGLLVGGSLMQGCCSKEKSNQLVLRACYQHYKGGYYEILAIAKHTETEEPLVIYRSVSDPEQVWARPKSMFCEDVMYEGVLVPRFRFVGAR